MKKEEIINFDQSGFLKSRYKGQNITTNMDLMQFTTQENISALIIAVDFEKAFAYLFVWHIFWMVSLTPSLYSMSFKWLQLSFQKPLPLGFRKGLNIMETREWLDLYPGWMSDCVIFLVIPDDTRKKSSLQNTGYGVLSVPSIYAAVRMLESPNVG